MPQWKEEREWNLGCLTSGLVIALKFALLRGETCSCFGMLTVPLPDGTLQINSDSKKQHSR